MSENENHHSDTHLIEYRVGKVEEAISGIHDLVSPLQEFVTEMRLTIRFALFVAAPIFTILTAVLSAMITNKILN